MAQLFLKKKTNKHVLTIQSIEISQSQFFKNKEISQPLLILPHMICVFCNCAK